MHKQYYISMLLSSIVWGMQELPLCKSSRLFLNLAYFKPTTDQDYQNNNSIILLYVNFLIPKN